MRANDYIEIPDNEISEAVDVKRHEQLAGLLKQLIFAIKDDAGGDKELMAAIKQQTSSIESLSKNISEIKVTVNSPKVDIPKQDAPQVTVNTDNSKVIDALNKGMKDIKESCDQTNRLLLQLIEVKTSDIELTPERNFKGLINKVTAKMIFNKKYQA